MAEFESAHRHPLVSAGKTKTDAQRPDVSHALPDRRGLARQMLDLATATKDEATAVDAWSGPSGIASRAPRETKRSRGCRALPPQRRDRRDGVRSPPRFSRRGSAQARLQTRTQTRRFVDAQVWPVPGWRPAAPTTSSNWGADSPRTGRNRPMREISFFGRGRPDRPHWPRRLSTGYNEHSATFRDTRRARYHRQSRCARRKPRTYGGPDSRAIAESHPQPEVRWQAECGLAIRQMEIVSLVADLRSVAAEPPGSKSAPEPHSRRRASTAERPG